MWTQYTKFHRHDVARGAFANWEYVPTTLASDRTCSPADVWTMELLIPAVLYVCGSLAFCSSIRTTRGIRRWFIIKQNTPLSITVARSLYIFFIYIYKYIYIYQMFLSKVTYKCETFNSIHNCLYSFKKFTMVLPQHLLWIHSKKQNQP